MKHYTRTLTIFLFISFAFAQTQLGSDINGEAATDYSGYSVSMNSAGDRVAIGANWNDGNDYGKPVSAGMYLYQIQAGEYISTKKMVLLK